MTIYTIEYTETENKAMQYGAAAVHPYTRSTGGDYVSTAGTVILSLSAGDYVTVFVDEGTIYATGAAHNNFSGFLIG